MRSNPDFIGWLVATATLVLSPIGCGGEDDPIAIDDGGTSTGNASTGSASTGSASTGDSGVVDDTQACDDVEQCNGLDDDCDGEIDEGCECVTDQTQPCFGGDPAQAGVGECIEGTQTCDADGQWGECVDEVLPTEESCNGLDDDCNGQTDEGFSSVTCGEGLCQVMAEECVDGVPQPCEPGEPQTELCNRLDDDCDGEVDEGCECVEGQVQSCYTGAAGTQGVGECQDGSQTCDLQGSWGPCEGDVTPQAELCNGLDDDCNGMVDDGNPEGGNACGTGLQGACAAGTETCMAGALVCVQDLMPAPELCNGVDDDCDGAADEGNPAGGSGCDTGQPGICAAGTETCTGGMLACQQDLMPAPESCNGLDDDCDGTVDDGNPGGGGACSTGLLGVCAAGTGDCSGGALVCTQTTPPGPESCNGLDDDCDGTVDGGDPGGGGACNTGLQGVCAAGTEHCQGGALQCTQDVAASPELCNAIDDDCDGIVDDGNPGGGAGCGTGLLGVCANGQITCTGGALSCTQTQFPSPEVCGDGLDNDCNGVIDDGCPACPPGYTSCDADPDCETNTLDDGSNCGGCGITCADDEFCDSGSCTPCGADLRDCDDDGGNACEVDIQSDAVNCGGCGNVCGTPAGGLCCGSVCTDGDANNCGACGEPCFEGMLVINELMNNPALVGDAAGEWFELYNPNPFDIDVRGFVISDLGTDSHMVVSVTPVIIPALSVAVLGNNDDPLANGGAPVIYQYTGIAMANGADELVVTAYGQELDRVEWNAGFPQNGASQELSVNHQTFMLNDVLANWCVATTPYGAGDLGTPGLVNACAL